MRGTPEDAGTLLHGAGWIQGSVIGLDVIAALGQSDASWAVLISQDCDIVQSATVEHSVEVILGTDIDAVRPDCQHGKNPRQLDLILMHGDVHKHVCFDARKRLMVRKEVLASHSPDHQLSPESTDLLVRWVAKRYTRVAWPDQFNERLKTISTKLERLFKDDTGKSVTAIWLRLDPLREELPSDENYRLMVWLTVSAETRLDAAESRRVQQFENRFRELLDHCKGIDLEEIETRSESDVTLEDLRQFRRFDRDYRSLAPTPGGATAPDER